MSIRFFVTSSPHTTRPGAYEGSFAGMSETLVTLSGWPKIYTRHSRQAIHARPVARFLWRTPPGLPVQPKLAPCLQAVCAAQGGRAALPVRFPEVPRQTRGNQDTRSDPARVLFE